jgi:hypothetical protein
MRSLFSHSLVLRPWPHYDAGGAPATGGGVATGGSSAGTFVCGDQFCTAYLQYCMNSRSDVEGVPDTYRCNPLPERCFDAPTGPSCDCLALSVCGSSTCESCEPRLQSRGVDGHLSRRLTQAFGYAAVRSKGATPGTTLGASANRVTTANSHRIRLPMRTLSENR